MILCYQLKSNENIFASWISYPIFIHDSRQRIEASSNHFSKTLPAQFLIVETKSLCIVGTEFPLKKKINRPSNKDDWKWVRNTKTWFFIILHAETIVVYVTEVRRNFSEVCALVSSATPLSFCIYCKSIKWSNFISIFLFHYCRSNKCVEYFQFREFANRKLFLFRNKLHNILKSKLCVCIITITMSCCVFILNSSLMISFVVSRNLLNASND